MSSIDKQKTFTKPYFMAGAGRLASSVWKSGGEGNRFEYRFNLFVIKTESGASSSWLAPDDLRDLVKLTGVLAREIAIDGCVDNHLRVELAELAEAIEHIAGLGSEED